MFLSNIIRKMGGTWKSQTANRLFCPICNKEYRCFLPFGAPLRQNALCPGCKSLERHRLLWIALNNGFISGSLRKRLLHVAPEKCLSLKLLKYFDYVSIDLDGSLALIQMDLTELRFPDEHFDAIVCNHVLEHIPDDGKALSELYRVLKPGGWACIQVPIDRESTDEDITITCSKEKARRFGQHDHVRSYGKDFINRLEYTGFKVSIISKEVLLDQEMLHKISVECEESVWISMKN